MKFDFDKEIVSKGLNVIFASKANRNSSRYIDAVDKNGRITDEFQKKAGIPMKRLKCFLALVDCPTREELIKMLNANVSGSYRQYVSESTDYVNLLNYLYDNDHFDENESISKTDEFQNNDIANKKKDELAI